MSIDNEELIIKQHELKLKIQKAIIEDQQIYKTTPDIGYTSWLTAERIVNDLVVEKESKKAHRKKNFIDFFLPKL